MGSLRPPNDHHSLPPNDSLMKTLMRGYRPYKLLQAALWPMLKVMVIG